MSFHPSLRKILSEDEIRKYKEEWKNFRGKDKFNSSYNTHSARPVISKVYHFENKPFFRAHVFGMTLKKFDPYFMCSEYFLPFWDATHYFLSLQQMWAASAITALGKKYSEMRILEVPLRSKWSKKLYFKDNISIEAIADFEKLLLGKRQIVFANFYSDKNDEMLSQVEALVYWTPRNYVESISKIKRGDQSEVEGLIQKIERQDIMLHSKIDEKYQRKKLLSTKESLINSLRSRKLPEEELHDFFSFWDPE